ncbi:MAG: GIDE domain-containing protein, partial [Nanoarchaeota archaeon]
TIKDGVKGIPFYVKDKTGQVLVDSKGAHIDIPADFQFQTGTFKAAPPASVQKFLVKEGISATALFGFNRQLRFTEYYIAPKDALFVMGTAADNPHVGEATAVQGVEDVMIQSGGPLFYISDKSEKDVLAGYGWRIRGGLFGGGALSVVCLVIIFKYLGLL